MPWLSRLGPVDEERISTVLRKGWNPNLAAAWLRKNYNVRSFSDLSADEREAALVAFEKAEPQK